MDLDPTYPEIARRFYKEVEELRMTVGQLEMVNAQQAAELTLLAEEHRKLQDRFITLNTFNDGVLAGADAVRRENERLKDIVDDLAADCLANVHEAEHLHSELEMTTKDRNEALKYIAQMLAYNDEEEVWEEATRFLCEHKGYEDTSKEEPEPDLSGNWMKAVREGTAKE